MPEHGTQSRYSGGCRCEECRYAHAEKHRIYMQERSRLAELGKAIEAMVKK